MQGWGFANLPSQLYHPYLVCILFGIPSLHPFTFLMFFKSCIYGIYYHSKKNVVVTRLWFVLVAWMNSWNVGRCAWNFLEHCIAPRDWYIFGVIINNISVCNYLTVASMCPTFNWNCILLVHNIYKLGIAESSHSSLSLSTSICPSFLLISILYFLPIPLPFPSSSSAVHSPAYPYKTTLPIFKSFRLLHLHGH